MDPQVQVPMLLQDESMIVPYLLPVTTAWLSWEDTALGYSLNVPSMVQPYLADVFQKVSSLYGNTTFNDMQKGKPSATSPSSDANAGPHSHADFLCHRRL